MTNSIVDYSFKAKRDKQLLIEASFNHRKAFVLYLKLFKIELFDKLATGIEILDQDYDAKTLSHLDLDFRYNPTTERFCFTFINRLANDKPGITLEMYLNNDPNPVPVKDSIYTLWNEVCLEHEGAPPYLLVPVSFILGYLDAMKAVVIDHTTSPAKTQLTLIQGPWTVLITLNASALEPT